MIRQAIAAGLTEEQFWQMTPAQLARYYDGVTDRRRLRLVHDVSIAWYGAMFRRADRLPPLSEVTNRIMQGKNTRRQTWQEMRDNIRAFKAVAKGALHGE